ncbi:MAG: Gmad2 immunoglobulin-like domain-containing protein [Patescibacteria group bacterium]|nr:Gmad2 immunoglobulin-like domain-containing protein [Patescibacteria group bacterium]
MNKLTVIIGLGIIIIIGAAALFLLPPNQANAPTNGAGTGKEDLIVAMYPKPGEKITSPLVATGEARGTWYFEASFPITVLDAEENVIGQGYAQAQSDWMTEEFVYFESIPIEFEAQPAGSTGTVVLHKDNPSGLPEHDDELRIPVIF